MLFLSDETIPPMNNASKQALRWSVIFRKVTIGFRSDWGAELFVQVRSLVNTAKRQGISALDAIARAITSQQTELATGLSNYHCFIRVFFLKPMAGFEPATARLRIECSTTEPHRQFLKLV